MPLLVLLSIFVALDTHADTNGGAPLPPFFDFFFPVPGSPEPESGADAGAVGTISLVLALRVNSSDWSNES